jgi:hypothetical protein
VPLTVSSADEALANGCWSAWFRISPSRISQIEVLPVLALRTGDIMEIGTNSNHVGSDLDEFVASAQVASDGFEFPMKHVPIALLIFVAPAFAEELIRE